MSSAYKLAAHLTFDSVDGQECVWSKMWCLKIPPKVKSWLWRCCKNYLPTKDKLRQKGIDVNTICDGCSLDRETLWHVYMQCPIALDCWEEMGLRNQLETLIPEVDSLSELFVRMVVLLDIDRAESCHDGMMYLA
ncbi:hypothetical protein ACS0TY_010173 [Phlomoides rotata]